MCTVQVPQKPTETQIVPWHAPLREIVSDPENWKDYYLLRFTKEYLDIGSPEFKLFYEKYVVEEAFHLVVSEDGEEGKNPHFHMFFKTVVRMQAIRTHINRKLSLKGNEAYSLKSADGDLCFDHVKYLCKGTGTGKGDGPDVEFRHPALTDVVIEELHQAYWDSRTAFERISGKKRKKNDPAGAQILKICKQILDHNPKKSAILEDELIDITLKWYSDNKWSMNTFQMKAVVNWVSYNLNDNSNRVELMRQALKFN